MFTPTDNIIVVRSQSPTVFRDTQNYINSRSKTSFTHQNCTVEQTHCTILIFGNKFVRTFYTEIIVVTYVLQRIRNKMTSISLSISKHFLFTAYCARVCYQRHVNLNVNFVIILLSWKFKQNFTQTMQKMDQQCNSKTLCGSLIISHIIYIKQIDATGHVLWV